MRSALLHKFEESRVDSVCYVSVCLRHSLCVLFYPGLTHDSLNYFFEGLDFDEVTQLFQSVYVMSLVDERFVVVFVFLFFPVCDKLFSEL